ncbi:hypothetical protein ZIOFF_061525 [Zingiber officinale]|uniref:Uncharacterized protein n=1 Tax=Zingiber officinale TaxID=94328 RepID=A0A8J5KIE2_ZINOF|nr:hypothetical protein ZIOFF_061525 [Zingiber officinale]
MGVAVQNASMALSSLHDCGYEAERRCLGVALFPHRAVPTLAVAYLLLVVDTEYSQGAEPITYSPLVMLMFMPVDHCSSDSFPPPLPPTTTTVPGVRCQVRDYLLPLCRSWRHKCGRSVFEEMCRTSNSQSPLF